MYTHICAHRCAVHRQQRQPVAWTNYRRYFRCSQDACGCVCVWIATVMCVLWLIDICGVSFKLERNDNTHFQRNYDVWNCWWTICHRPFWWRPPYRSLKMNCFPQIKVNLKRLICWLNDKQNGLRRGLMTRVTYTTAVRTANVVFRADTPFMFIVRHDDTELPLFYSSVFEPTSDWWSAYGSEIHAFIASLSRWKLFAMLIVLIKLIKDKFKSSRTILHFLHPRYRNEKNIISFWRLHSPKGNYKIQIWWMDVHMEMDDDIDVNELESEYSTSSAARQ